MNTNLCFGSFFEIFADRVLTDQTPGHIPKILWDYIIDVAKFHNDEAVLKGLDVLEEAYEKIAEEEKDKEKSWEEKKKIGENYRRGFIEDLKNIYWDLPDARESRKTHDEINYHPTLLKSKAWIVQKVINEWDLENCLEWSTECFRFIIAAHSPSRKEWDGESEDETKSRGRKSFREEQGKIEALVREKTGYGRKSEHFEFWLRQPWVPEDLIKFLILGRARIGGTELVFRELKFAELLQPLNPEDCSLATLNLHKNLCEKIRRMDLRVKELLDQMQNGWGLGAKKIGESEYVSGKIETIFHNLEQISIIVYLYEDCEEALGKDIAGRARRHIQTWKNKYGGKEFEKLHITLNIVEGKNNLNISSTL